MSDQPPPIPTDPIPPASSPPPPPPPSPYYPGPLGGGIQPHRGGLILALGISSIAVLLLGCCDLFFPPCCLGTSAITIGLAVPAWVMANADLRAMAEGRVDPAGRGQTEAGRVCAIIAVILCGLSLLGCLGSISVSGFRPYRFGRPWHPWRP
jgi:hypothetical protein